MITTIEIENFKEIGPRQWIELKPQISVCSTDVGTCISLHAVQESN
jgi:hypothetical protein